MKSFHRNIFIRSIIEEIKRKRKSWSLKKSFSTNIIHKLLGPKGKSKCIQTVKRIINLQQKKKHILAKIIQVNGDKIKVILIIWELNKYTMEWNIIFLHQLYFV